MSRETFPQDYDDPFNQQTYKGEDAPSWLHSPNRVVPRWRLQTTEEKIEQQHHVTKLESKLQKIKQRPDNHYSYKHMPDISQSILSSETDSDDGYNQDGSMQEESHDEGLPLLWQQNQSTSPLDTVKKTEDQYHHSWRWWIVTSCFNG